MGAHHNFTEYIRRKANLTKSMLKIRTITNLCVPNYTDMEMDRVQY